MSATVVVVLVVVAVVATIGTVVLPPKPWGWLSAGVVAALFAVYVVMDWSWRWVPATILVVGLMAFKRWRKRPASVTGQNAASDVS